MSLAQRIWKKDWLKLKSSFLRVNHQFLMQGPPEVSGRARRQTHQTQNKLDSC